MKKIVVVFLAIFYLVPAVGFSMDIHWCGKNIAKVDVNATDSKKCACGKKMGCCKDVHLSVKLKDSQKSAAQLSVPKNYPGKLLSEVLLPSFLWHAFGNGNPGVSANHSPPFKPNEPVYLRYSVFRI